MRIKLDDGSEYYVDGDTVPDGMTVAQLKSVLVPWSLHEARMSVSDAKLALDAGPQMPSDSDLMEWAKSNHPSAAARSLLIAALANAEAALAEFEGR